MALLLKTSSKSTRRHSTFHNPLGQVGSKKKKKKKVAYRGDIDCRIDHRVAVCSDDQSSVAVKIRSHDEALRAKGSQLSFRNESASS